MTDTPPSVDLPFDTSVFVLGDKAAMAREMQTFVTQLRVTLDEMKGEINRRNPKMRRNVTVNTAVEVTQSSARSTGSVANGFGPRHAFKSVGDGGNEVDLARLDAIFSDVTDGSEDAYLALSTIAAGTVAERLRISNSGFSFDSGTTFMGSYLNSTWTPVLDTTGTDPDTITHGGQTGAYVRLGHAVLFIGYVSLSAFTLGGGTGNLLMTGLPVTSRNSSGTEGMVVVEMANVNFDAAAAQVTGRVIINSTQIEFIETHQGGATQNVALADLTASSTVRVRGFYFV